MSDNNIVHFKLVEKVVSAKVEYLLKLETILDDPERNASVVTHLEKYQKGFKKAKKYITEYRTSKDWGQYGRFYPRNTFGRYGQSTGLALMKSLVRGYLAEDHYLDIDIKKCHWYLLRWLFKKYELETEDLDQILKNYDEIAEFVSEQEHISKGEAKKSIFSILYSSPTYKSQITKKVLSKFPYFRNFYNELYGSFLALSKEEYAELYEINTKNVTKKKGKNYKNIDGSFIATLNQHVERLVITDIVKTAQKNGYSVGAIIHDGFLLEKSPDLDLQKCINTIYEAMKSLYPLFEFELVHKPFAQHPFPPTADILEAKEKAIEGTEYFVLIRTMVKYAKENNLKHDRKSVFQQSEENPMVYNYLSSVEAFIEDLYADFPLLDSSPQNYQNLLKFFDTRDKRDFPVIHPNMDWFAFKNGCLNIRTMDFITTDNAKQEEYNGIVARKFFAVDYNPLNQTPMMDSIINFQIQDDEAREWFWIFIARLFFKPDNDGLQVIPYIYGERSTGKSTIREVLVNLFNFGEVATLNSNYEKTFGLDTIADRLVLIPNDLPEDLASTIQIDLLKSMAEGNVVNVAQKYKKSQMKRWELPSWFISNFLPNYQDTNGAVSKRLAIYIFREEVVEQNSNLFQQIVKTELPAIIHKALTLYHKHTFNSTFESVRPKYFDETAQEYIESVETIFQFLKQTDSKDKEGNIYRLVLDQKAITPLDEFKRRYVNWCEFNKIKSNWQMGDYTALKKFNLTIEVKKICKSCNNISKSDCCPRYATANRVSKKVVKGVRFTIERADDLILYGDGLL